jgi:hypothetical protein
MRAARRLAPLLFAAALPIAAQETPSAAPAPPPEGGVIVNLPSADVPRAGTLTLLITHRFSQSVPDGDIHTLFSFDSAADIKIGLAYAPLPNLEVSFERDPAHCFCGLSGASSSKAQRGLEIYEVAAKYRFLSLGPARLSLRVGEDWRTAEGLEDRSGFFAQAILALSVGSRVRITAVPTYVSKTSRSLFGELPRPFKDVFNVPVGVSVGVTRSIYLHGEMEPRVGDGGSRGTGWIASVEKTVLRHRFAFTVGNLRATTVDQYVASDFRRASAIPAFNPHDYFFGFNITRLWNLK